MSWSSVAAASLLSLLVALASPAWAEAPVTATQRAQADALFSEARALMESGRFTEACAKFAESERLDPAGGTVLNLAICEETAGRLASALLAYRESLVFAERERHAKRIAHAQQKIRELESRVAELRLTFGENAAVAGLRVELDGRALSAQMQDGQVSLPLDKGTHALRVTAPAHETWTSVFTVSRDGERVVVEVPVLQPTEPEPNRSSGPPLGSILLGASGLAAAGVGGYFYLSGRADHSDITGKCEAAQRCREATYSNDLDAARTDILAGQLAFWGGAAALTGGVLWWVLAPSGAKEEPPELHAGATPLPGGAQLTFQGRF